MPRRKADLLKHPTELIEGHVPNGSVCSLSFVAAFFAHEPWLVLSGQRGTRTKRQFAASAKRRLVLLLSVSVTFGAAGLLRSSEVTRSSVLLVVSLALLTVLLSKFGRLHSAEGEVLAGAMLALLSVPITLASGQSLSAALAIAVAWASAFASGIFAVRAVIMKKKYGTRGRGYWGLLAVSVLLIVESCWATGPVVAVLPLTVASAVVFGLAPSPRHLRTIGWTLVGFTALAASLMVLASRASWFQTCSCAVLPL